MLRSIASVAAGTIAWGILWAATSQSLLAAVPESFTADGGTESAGVLLFLLVVSVALSVLAGWLTARLAPGNAWPHVYALGALQLAIGLAVQIGSWALMPAWFHIPFLALLVPGVLVGGRLRLRSRLARAPA